MCRLHALPLFLSAYPLDILEKKSEKGSDPGLCVARLDRGLNRNRLIDFGKNAKQQVLTKNAAYTLADQAGIHLSEHGGTGQGGVCAVAGIGDDHDSLGVQSLLQCEIDLTHRQRCPGDVFWISVVGE